MWDRELMPNTPRYTRKPGHVESWFFRANHPTRPLAIWVRTTILARLNGETLAETWFIAFDGEQGQTHVQKRTVPFQTAKFTADSIHVDALKVTLADSIVGTIGDATLDLQWRPVVVGTVSLYPYSWLLTGPFPKSKLLTPQPWLWVEGSVNVAGNTWTIDGWTGMQGHNWGKENAFEYAWGHCVFEGAGVVVEGFTGRVKVAGRLTPWMSTAVVRRGKDQWRFDVLFDFWDQQASITPGRWTLGLTSAAGSLTLEMDSTAVPTVTLDYENPDGRIAKCHNSKLAAVTLTVTPRNGEPFTCRSAHGGALEILR